jgi:murein DD-endopeptidase MepM/ murein hydrolase activator NlpD
VGRVIAAAGAGFVALVVVIAALTGAVVNAVTGGMLATNASTAAGGGSCVVTAALGVTTRPAGLSSAQTRNAATIVAVGKGMRVPRYGWVIAVATALQESDLIDETTATDHDSLGLFQQRPSQGWGTPRQVTTPTYAAHAFYTHLLRVPGWQHMPVTVAAQAVQRSAYPDAYAAHAADARAIVAALTGVPAADCHTAPTGSRWVRPASGPITSGYHTAGRPDHDGVDIGAPRGATVRAAAAGVVAVARCDPATGDCNRDGSIQTPGCGWYVEIRHAGDITTRYCHLEHRPLVRAGQTVTAGQTLGVVGMSGNATGPHLHFEVHRGYPATGQNATSPTAFMDAHGVNM